MSTHKNRRDFIKTSAAVTGLAATSSLLPNLAFAKDSEAGVVTAAHWGPIKAQVKDGKVVSSANALKNAMPNSLQTAVASQVHNPSRIKKPMIRKGYLASIGKSDGKRGSDEFVEVTWDKAYEIIEAELKRIYKDHSPASVFAGSYGWRSSGSLHKAFTLMQRFLSLAGGFSGHTGDYSAAAAEVIMPHIVGSADVYYQQTSWDLVIKHADTVVMWGMNPISTLKIAWTASDEQGLAYIKKLKESGKKIVYIDPIKNETVQYFGKNATWIAPKPMTDVALMLGIAHTLVTEKLHNTKFLDKYCVGYDKFEEYLLGKTDKTPKDAEWASKITGLSAKSITDLAKVFGKNKTMLMSGWGMQRQQHGEQSYWMLVTLAAMLGQIGQPGTGFGTSYHYANGGNPTRTGGVLPNITVGKPTKGAQDWETGSKYTIPVARIADALLNPGQVIDHDGKKVTYPDIKLVWWCGGNPFSHQQDTNKLRKAWQKPDTVIVSDSFWTATAKHADIVLPITTSFERNDITQTGDYSNQHIVPMKKLVEPQFESKDDLVVFTELSDKFGFKDKFTEGKSEMDWLKSFYDEAHKAARQNRVLMPSFEEFWDKNEVFEFKNISEKSKNFTRYADFIKDPLVNPLGTPSGKFEIYSKTIAKMGYDDCPGHPTWMEPIEYLGNAKPEAPLHLMSSHPADRLHSQLNQTTLREKYAVANREPVLINTKDAEKRGIKNGDIVRIFNTRGQVLAGAVVTDKIRENVIDLHEGAWYDPADTSDNALCKNGCANVLTMDIPTSKLANGNCAYTATVEVEKYKGQAPELTAFKEPAIAKV